MRNLLPTLLVLAATPAFAQSVQRLHGVVIGLDGPTLTIKAEDDATLRIALPPDIRIGAVRDRTLSDIKPGEFVGSAAIRGRDGKLHAQEVHIFPEALRAPAKATARWTSPSRP